MNSLNTFDIRNIINYSEMLMYINAVMIKYIDNNTKLLLWYFMSNIIYSYYILAIEDENNALVLQIILR